MKTIKQPVTGELIIQKSRFLTFLEPMTELSQLEERQRELKKLHRKANHVCYAYRFGLEQPAGHFSDDGEPSQTAGLPMYQVLEGEDITNVAAFVVRYFGGIKLGTGGLVRAYSQAVKQVIDQTEFQTILARRKFELNYAYAYHNQIVNLLAETPHQPPEFLADITWQVYLADDSLLEQLTDITEGTIAVKDFGPVFIGQTKRGTLELGGHDERID